MQKARICAQYRDSYRILTTFGEIVARVKGRLRHAATSPLDFPAVGDWVVYENCGDGTAIIDAVLPRSSAIVRKTAGTAVAEQIVAANVDWLLVVCGLDGDFNVRRIERYIALARTGGVRPAIVLNKVDVCGDLEERFLAVEALRTQAPVHIMSALYGDGLESLAAYLEPDTTIALVGSSGAGKSTITNALLGEDRQSTNAVRMLDDRGKHTTTARSLFALPSGAYLIDTPGMRELQLWATENDVEDAFCDIQTLAGRCRFADCAHDTEPGCAVLAALGSTLDTGRFENYKKLLREQAFLERKVDVNAALANKARWKKIHQNARADIRFRKGR